MDELLKEVSENEKEKILQSFFKNGKLITFPSQLKKKLIVLQEICNKFEIGKEYSEQEVNAKIKVIFDDYCVIRRYLVDGTMMKRENGIYTRIS